MSSVNWAIAKIMSERSFIRDWRMMRHELNWPRRCPYCNDWSITVRTRHNTFMYTNPKDNLNTCCWDCMTEVWDEAAERWAAYHSDRY